MQLFGKKNNDKDELEQENLEKRSRKLPKDKDFKDLKPENRKKRKEPIRPWGRRDRVFIAILLIATAGTSAYLGLSARDWKLPGLPRVNLKLPSFPFGEDTIVIEGNNENKKKADSVTSSFIAKTDTLSGVYGLYVVDLTNGFSYGFLEEDTFQAASLIKLPVIAGMYLEAEKGSISLESKYKLKNSDKISGAGSLYLKPEGYEISYRDLVRLMGHESDNTAFNICRKKLGDTKIDTIAAQIGMTGTDIENNETTPKDIGTFFSKLWALKIVNQKNRDEILSYLTDTIYENWLVAGVPNNVRVAHKYGREVHVVNDAGIVYTNQPYVVVIMTKGVVEREADEVIPELSKIVYDANSD
jgi:beta-lactamase class A